MTKWTTVKARPPTLIYALQADRAQKHDGKCASTLQATPEQKYALADTAATQNAQIRRQKNEG
jgi:hypothetical protein